MSGKAMSWSRTVKVGSSSAKQVLRELCISQNELTGQCTLSINSLIEITELSETTVLKALATLKARGFIQVEKVKTQNGWGNSYSFPLLESTPKNEGTPNSRDTPKIKGTPSSEGEGTPNSRDTGTPKTRDLKKEEKKDKKISSSSSDPEPLTLTNDETPAACTRKKAPAVPFAQIVEIYNAKLGNDLGICRKLSETRKSVLRQRWKDVGEIVESSDPKEILSGFGCYYDKIARSSFLMGRATNFKATFDWIHKSENFIKTYEGNYENGRYRN